MQMFSGSLRRARPPVRWAWPPDKRERLSTVAALCGSPRTVLDIGGRGRELARLLPGAQVRTVNVEQPCDVLVTPGPLPFPDAYVDAAVSTDVLEHVPAEQRPAFVSELVRVARHRVVLCFPAGSDAKDRAEQELAQQLQERFDLRLAFLDEHLELGLPRPADVEEMVGDAVARWAPGSSVRWAYTRRTGEGDALLLDAMALRHRRDVRVLGRVLRGWWGRPVPATDPVAGPDSDRAYCVVELRRV